MNYPLAALIFLALVVGLVQLGRWTERRRRDVQAEADGWLTLSSQQGAGQSYTPPPPAEPFDPALIDAKMQALRDEISDLAKTPVTPFFPGDPVVLAEPPDDHPEGTVWRIRPAPPEVLVIWGTDEEPTWHHLHELRSADT